MIIVVVETYDARIVDCIVDSECPGTVITRRRVVSNGLVELVLIALFIFEFQDPLGPRTVENGFDLVVVILGEFLGRLEAVHYSTEIIVSLRTCEDNNCCFCHYTRS